MCKAQNLMGLPQAKPKTSVYLCLLLPVPEGSLVPREEVKHQYQSSHSALDAE